MDQALIKRVQKQTWLVRSPRRLQIAVFVLVCAISLLGVFGIETAESRRKHAALERNAADIAATLRQLDGEHGIYLRASAALFAVQANVSAQQFAQLESDLDFSHHRQASLGVGWVPRVAPGQLRQSEKALAADTSPGFTIRDFAGNARTEGGAGQEFFPIVYFQPQSGLMSRDIGIDMYSDPTRRMAMDQAATSDGPIASGPLQVLQDQNRPSTPGFVIYMPVFAGQGRDRLNLRGFVYSPFRAGEVLRLAAQLAGQHIPHVAAYDGQIAPAHLLARLGEPTGGGPALVQRVRIAGRPWLLVVSEPPSVGISRLSQITILSGLIVAVLLAALIRMTYQRLSEQQQVLEWRATEAGIRNSLTRELNHRVKNTLATVLSIVTLTRRRATDLESYVESLSGRIRALSATHDLLTTNDWASIDLRQIIVAELQPYIGDNQDHVLLAGPDIHLAPNDALTLGMAVHELATNAAKYGSLSTLRGRISIGWHKVNDAAIEIQWQEIDGPVVAQPTKRGFGRDLIENFNPDGLKCVFRVPLRKPGPFVLRTGGGPQPRNS
jgi:two-component sensor histidine kinase/CHASE1-domain containing sensor protein